MILEHLFRAMTEILYRIFRVHTNENNSYIASCPDFCGKKNPIESGCLFVLQKTFYLEQP